MRRSAAIVFLLVCVAAGTLAWSQTQIEPKVPAPSAETGLMTDETANAWFVELASAPTADGTGLATVKNEKAAFRANAAKAGLKFQERFAFDTLWNGLSIRIDRSQVSALKRIDGVKAVYPVTTVSMPKTEAVSDPNLAYAIQMTGANLAQNTLGLTGKGVKVAIMDTGIDYKHPDLGGCFGQGCRVVGGWDFVGDAYNADPATFPYNPVPTPDPDPMDCAGHGTHVAGIIGANGVVKGVAPNVTIRAYRVFGCVGSTDSDIMLAAMEKILADGNQVMNMSIGSAFQWPQYPTAQAADRLVNKGISVVASFGNSGANGIYSGSAPGMGDKVIGVASFDNTYVQQAAFTVSSDAHAVGFNPATGAPIPPMSGDMAITKTGTPGTTNDACNPLPAGSLAGQAVLIRRGTCSFYIKSMNAQQAGAIAVVLYNNAAGALNPTVAGNPPITIPVVAITAAEGALINNRIAAGATTITWTTQTVATLDPTGNLISSFSSYGLSPDLNLKPDIGAPGGFIWSTYPTALGSYASLSGTSMASPHVAGAVALLLEAYPHTPSNAVRTILQNSAQPHDWWGAPGAGYLDNVHRQGAGMLNIYNSLLATTRVEPGKLALGESQAGPAVRTLTITNNSSDTLTYTLSNATALATGPEEFSPSFWIADANVVFSANTVTVPARSSASVTATITAPTDPQLGIYGGYIVVDDGTSTYSVPYAGFIGDYQAKQVLTPTTYGFPWLASVVGTNYVNQPGGATYTLVNGDQPYILLHLDHQSRRVRFTIVDAVTGKNYQRMVPDEQYVGRNSTATGFFAWNWDGITINGNQTKPVPNGQYRVIVTVEKALATSSDPVETWTSPVITIARP